MLDSTEKILQKLYVKVAADQNLKDLINASYRFTILGEKTEVFVLDFVKSKFFEDLNCPVDCELKLSHDTLADIVNGKINPQVCFLNNKLVVTGQTEAALKLVQIW